MPVNALQAISYSEVAGIFTCDATTFEPATPKLVMSRHKPVFVRVKGPDQARFRVHGSKVWLPSIDCVMSPVSSDGFHHRWVFPCCCPPGDACFAVVQFSPQPPAIDWHSILYRTVCDSQPVPPENVGYYRWITALWNSLSTNPPDAGWAAGADAYNDTIARCLIGHPGVTVTENTKNFQLADCLAFLFPGTSVPSPFSACDPASPNKTGTAPAAPSVLSPLAGESFWLWWITAQQA